MTRTEAIAIIHAKLMSLDDAAVRTVADIVQDMAGPGTLPRPLTAGERDLIEQSKADFREGRTFTVEEARAHSDAFLEILRAKYPTAP